MDEQPGSTQQEVVAVERIQSVSHLCRHGAQSAISNVALALALALALARGRLLARLLGASQSRAVSEILAPVHEAPKLNHPKNAQ
jgi:hypothetical protein